MDWMHDELLDGRRLWVLTVVDLWAYANGITLDFSRPGKPTDNAYVESFNATVRLECLGRHWFLDLPPQWFRQTKQ
jgi:transposase InsO family protein